MTIVRLGYFEDFKSNNTLLLEGDAEGLQQLVALLRSLREDEPDAIAIHALPFVEAHHGVRLTATRGTDDLGARHAGPAEFHWVRSRLGWEAAAEKVEALTTCENGHNYLEAAGDQVVVEVSKGEYGDEWWRKHG